MSGKTRNTVLSMAVVAMFMLCSTTILFVSDNSDALTTDYPLYLREGDTFSYTPQTNLESVIEIYDMENSASTASTYINWGTEDGMRDTLIGTFTEGSASNTYYNLHLKATWTAPNSPETKQYAYQHLYFMVFANLGLTLDHENFSVLAGEAARTIITPTVTGPTSGYSLSCSAITKDGSSQDLIVWDAENNVVKLSRDVVAENAETGRSSDEGTYTGTITARHGGTPTTPEEQVVTATFTVVIDSHLVILSSALFETFKGDTEHNTYTIVSNLDNSTELEDVTYQFINGNVPVDVWTSTDENKRTMTFDTSTLTFVKSIQGSEQYKDFSFGVKMNGTYKGEVVEDTQNVTLRVFADLVFLEKPFMVNAKAVTVTDADGKTDVQVTVGIARATKITYIWGDGQTNEVTTTTSSLQDYTYKHHYENDGEYTIKIRATNDNGTVTSYALYTTGDNGTINFEPLKEEVSEKKSTGAGFIWIICAAIAVISLVMIYGFKTYIFDYQKYVTYGLIAVAVVLYYFGI